MTTIKRTPYGKIVKSENNKQERLLNSRATYNGNGTYIIFPRKRSVQSLLDWKQ